MDNSKLIKVILGLLILQFVLGMLANLYSKIPNPPYDVFHQLGYINLHAINGTLLLALSIMLLVKSRKTVSFKPVLGGLIGIALAFTFGELFVFTQVEIFSFFMSLSFIGAFLSYSQLAFSNAKLQ